MPDSHLQSCGTRTILVTPLGPGEYTLLVEGWSDRSGEYTLTMSSDGPCDGTFSPTPTPTPSPTPAPAPTTSKPTLSPTASEPTPSPTPSPTTSEPSPSPTPSPTTSGPTPSPSPSPTTSEPTPSPSPSPTAGYCPEGYKDYGIRYDWGLGKITVASTHAECSARCTQFSGPQFSGGCKAYQTGMYFGMLLCRSYGGNFRTAGCASWANPTHPGVGSGALGSTHPTTNTVNVGGNCCSNSTFVDGF